MSERLAGVEAERAKAFYAAEADRYEALRPKGRRAAAGLADGFYDGVPMHWWRDWPLPFPLTLARASGARIVDVDGHRLVDFCLGDTGAMFGHSPAPVAAAVVAQARLGLATMLPGTSAAGVGALLRERFGLPHWQVATTATDANRFALRVARAVTRRPKILVFNGCYHGTVDETFMRLAGGKPVLRPGVLGQAVDLAETTRIVEFNDLAALQLALAHGDVACVITEPVLTNSAMVLPEPGFHDGLRRLTRAAGTLLLIDETHTISTGPGGYTGRYGLEPDLFVCGKPIAGGIPASVWGFTEAVAEALDSARQASPGFSGMGTTLSANPLALAAMRATLSEVMTDEAYEHMLRLAGVLEAGLRGVVSAAGLPWHVVRVGARVEFVFSARPLRNGSEAEATHIPLLERAVHLGLLNRGALIAPFHNMMLASPATVEADVAKLVAAFAAVVAALG
jgi:glutamate-1-semialdehyde 2,1-aminomutase